MKAIELYVEDGKGGFKTSNVFYCSNCRCVNRTKEGADNCCLCPSCKEKPCAKNSSLCMECRTTWQADNKKKQAEKEKAGLDKATTVTEWEYVWHNERMYSDIEQLIDDLITDDVAEKDFPEFVFAMKQVKFGGFSYDDFLENANGDMCEDVCVEEVLFGLDELKQEFKNCNELNKETVVYWEADYTRKVRVVYEQKENRN